MLGLTNTKQRLAKLNGPTVFSEHFRDNTAGLGLDFVHHFHRFDDANDSVFSDGLPHFNKSRGIRRRGAIKCAHHWGNNLFERHAFDRFRGRRRFDSRWTQPWAGLRWHPAQQRFPAERSRLAASLRRNPSFSISKTERSCFFIKSMIALISLMSLESKVALG